MIEQSNYSKQLKNPLIDMRCPACGRKLFEWVPSVTTWIVIRCKRCKSFVELRDGTMTLEQPGVDRVVALL